MGEHFEPPEFSTFMDSKDCRDCEVHKQERVRLQAEIKRLEGVIFRNCPDPRDGVGPGDEDIIRAIHQELEPHCDCGDCKEEREQAAEAESEAIANSLNHPDECDCEPCDERRGEVSYGDAKTEAGAKPKKGATKCRHPNG